MNLLDLPYDIHYELFDLCDHLAVFELSRTCVYFAEHPLITKRIAAFTPEQWLTVSRLALTLSDLAKYEGKLSLWEFIKHQQLPPHILSKITRDKSEESTRYPQFSNLVSRHQKLTESYIEQYWRLLDTRLLAQYQMLSEDFMFKYRFNLPWKILSKYQRMSSRFITKMQDLISWKYLEKNKVISPEILGPLHAEYLEKKKAKLMRGAMKFGSGFGINNIGADHYGNVFY